MSNIELVVPAARPRFASAAASTTLHLGALLLASGLVAGCGDAAQAQGGPPMAPPVSVAPAVQKPIADSEEFSGRLEAAEYVELRARVSGTIDKVHFTDGAFVKKGDLLFTIDPRPFDAEAARAEAQLVAARSRSDLAQSELGRAQKLLDSQAVSKSEVDQLASGQKTTQADIRSAEAALRVARLNVEYAHVRAPISGRVSRANVTAGNVVNDQTILTTIAGIAKLYAYFDGSERTFLRLKTGAGGPPPKVGMGLIDEQGFPHAGVVDFVDNRLNTQTGAIRMRATFDNPGGRLTPGLTARLRMESGTPVMSTLVAEKSIGTDQNKKFVYVVGSDGKPQFREVKLGPLQDGMRVVQGGVQPGEMVVVDGLQRIQPGMTVQPQVLQVDARGMPITPPPGPPGGPPAGGDKKKPA